jgi:hypothetical protein
MKNLKAPLKQKNKKIAEFDKKIALEVSGISDLKFD